MCGCGWGGGGGALVRVNEFKTNDMQKRHVAVFNGSETDDADDDERDSFSTKVIQC